MPAPSAKGLHVVEDWKGGMAAVLDGDKLVTRTSTADGAHAYVERVEKEGKPVFSSSVAPLEQES